MSKANQPRKYLRLISRASSMISAFEPSVMIPVRKLSAMSIANQASDINLNFDFVRKFTKKPKTLPNDHCRSSFTLEASVSWKIGAKLENRKRHKYWNEYNIEQ